MFENTMHVLTHTYKIVIAVTLNMKIEQDEMFSKKQPVIVAIWYRMIHHYNMASHIKNFTITRSSDIFIP